MPRYLGGECRLGQLWTCPRGGEWGDWRTQSSAWISSWHGALRTSTTNDPGMSQAVRETHSAEPGRSFGQDENADAPMNISWIVQGTKSGSAYGLRLLDRARRDAHGTRRDRSGPIRVPNTVQMRFGLGGGQDALSVFGRSTVVADRSLMVVKEARGQLEYLSQQGCIPCEPEGLRLQDGFGAADAAWDFASACLAWEIRREEKASGCSVRFTSGLGDREAYSACRHRHHLLLIRYMSSRQRGWHRRYAGKKRRLGAPVRIASGLGR